MNALALDFMLITDHSRFDYSRSLIESGFDFGGSKPMSRNVDHVVDSSNDSVHAIFVSFGAIASEVASREGAEIRV